MSDSHDQPHDHASEVHEGPIKTPRQLILTVLASFIVPIVVIILLVNLVDLGARPGAGSDSMLPQVIAQRLAPVGKVEFRDVSDPATVRSGEQVFQGQCSACHTSGAAGAPKFGDTAAWAPRIPQGLAALLNSALKGKGAMGPQGGGDYSDLEISRAVVYMANKGGASFTEPPAPAAAVAAATPNAAASAPN